MNWRSISLWLTLLIPTFVFSQKADSTDQAILDQQTDPMIQLSLKEVPVYPKSAHLYRATANSTHLDQTAFQNHDASSLQNTLNTLPGVKMEERGPGGSRRLSIRGSLLRAPFGIRNVKVYWNGSPLTSPDGSTPLEVIDPDDIERATVVKGPAGNRWGTGTGGALFFYSDHDYRDSSHVRIGVSYGSYGFARYAIKTGFKADKWNFQLKYYAQELAGYRAQEANEKIQLIWHARYEFKPEHHITFFGYQYQGSWELPGSIDSLSAATDPRQAWPYSVNANASVARNWTRLALSYHFKMNAHSTFKAHAYYNTTDKLNPYGTSPFFQGYKVEGGDGFGGYANFKHQFFTNRGNRGYLQANVEAQTEMNDFQEFDNVNGEPGKLRIESETRSNRALGYLMAKVPFSRHFSVDMGVTANYLAYQHRDLYQPDSINYSGNYTFQPVLLPFLELEQNYRDQSFRLNLSQGISQPTWWEILRADGSINTNLKAERASAVELSWFGVLYDQRWLVTLNTYAMRLDKAILPYTLVSGETIFENTGSTDQLGIEMLQQFPLYDQYNQSAVFAKVQPWFSVALQSYHFRDYAKDGINYAGKQVTGVPSYSSSYGLDIFTQHGPFLVLNGQLVGPVPLDDANTVLAQPYQLLHVKTGVNRIIGKWEVNLAVGINNLFDTAYTSFPQLNAIADRYYNPSPGRYYYTQIQLSRVF